MISSAFSHERKPAFRNKSGNGGPKRRVKTEPTVNKNAVTMQKNYNEKKPGDPLSVLAESQREIL